MTKKFCRPKFIHKMVCRCQFISIEWWKLRGNAKNWLVDADLNVSNASRILNRGPQRFDSATSVYDFGAAGALRSVSQSMAKISFLFVFYFVRMCLNVWRHMHTANIFPKCVREICKPRFTLRTHITHKKKKRTKKNIEEQINKHY